MNYYKVTVRNDWYSYHDYVVQAEDEHEAMDKALQEDQDNGDFPVNTDLHHAEGESIDCELFDQEKEQAEKEAEQKVRESLKGFVI